MNKKSPHKTHHTVVHTTDVRLHSGSRRHFFRVFLISLGVIVLFILLAVVGLFFLFQGSAIENETLNNRVEQSITSFLGPQYEVKLGPTKIEFLGLGKISITSSDVNIFKIADRDPVAVIGKILVGLDPLSLIKGQPKIHTVTIKSSTFDLRQFTTAAPVLPADLNSELGQLGPILEQLRSRLALSELQRIVINDSQLIGFRPGPRSTGTFDVAEFSLKVVSAQELEMKLVANSGISDLTASATYKHSPNIGATFGLNFKGLDLREWLQDPKTSDELKGFFGSNSKVVGRIHLPFNDDNSIQQPVLNFLVSSGDLRMGRKGYTNINHLALNFRLFPRLNRIIMERSQINAGGFRAQIVGAITPVDLETGLAGDVDYTLVVERAQGTPLQIGEKIHQATMLVEGGYERARKLLNIDQWKLAVVGGGMVGSGSLGFDSETPSFVLNGVSSGMPMAALKQFWPIFLATPVRKWVQEHVHGGQITSANIAASIPGGIIGRLHKGKRFGDDQLIMDIKVEDTRFDTFGKLPPIRSASGTIHVAGMRTKVNLDQGVVYVATGDPVKISGGVFSVADIGERPLKAETSFVASGPLSSVAQIADAKPLNVMGRLKMSPAQWSGTSEVDVIAKFPLKKKPQYREVAWQALIRLENARSAKPIEGRKVSQVNVIIDVSPDKAVITGNSTIDGIRGEVRLIEPVGKNSNVKRKRILKARMNAKQRQQIGLNVEPVIAGNVDVEMEQHEGSKSSQITVDLKNALISLPWIGWRKGQGIPASASFRMEIGKNHTKIHDLAMKGDGFQLQGSLTIDKSGVLTADFPKVSLNPQDDLAVRIRRNDKAYTITANGKYFDGRVLVNKLFHQKEATSQDGNATFDLSTNIERVKGFGKHIADNLVLHYSVKNGWLDALNLNTKFAQSKTATIQAKTAGENTRFKIHSQDAGSALSFLDLYTHMIGGELVSDLKRQRDKPFLGNVRVKNFIVVDEPKLKKLVSNQQLEDQDRGGRIKQVLSKIQTHRVRFPNAQATIEKGQGYLKVDGSLTGVQIGLTYNGTLYDKQNRMDLGGTFMPAFGLSRMVSAIPFVGQILSNGKDSGLIGITYRLSGPAASPKMELNPLSVVAPGIFKKVFEQRRN